MYQQTRGTQLKTDIGAFWHGNLTYLKNQCLEPEDCLLMLGPPCDIMAEGTWATPCPFDARQWKEVERECRKGGAGEQRGRSHRRRSSREGEGREGSVAPPSAPSGALSLVDTQACSVYLCPYLIT